MAAMRRPPMASMRRPPMASMKRPFSDLNFNDYLYLNERVQEIFAIVLFCIIVAT